jgi:hypothetical protein
VPSTSVSEELPGRLEHPLPDAIVVAAMQSNPDFHVVFLIVVTSERSRFVAPPATRSRGEPRWLLSNTCVFFASSHDSEPQGLRFS